MSGHSHAKTIKKQKDAADLQRGKAFSRLAREIAIAVRDGGADPKTNFKLRLAIEKGRQVNMPKDNIERAIKKGSGGAGGEKWEEITFEGYGPAGVAVIVETATDNKNRTTAEIKNIFERGKGTLASPGAVLFQFKKFGLLIVEKKEGADDQILRLIDLGAEEIEEVSDGIKILTSPGKLGEVKQRIKESGFLVRAEELTMLSTTPLVINNEEKAQKVLKFIESLEEHEDVQKVFANFSIKT